MVGRGCSPDGTPATSWTVSLRTRRGSVGALAQAYYDDPLSWLLASRRAPSQKLTEQFVSPNIK
jgi:hypothetical protein